MGKSRKSKIRSDNYVVIHGWMVKELDLSDTELIVYAVIYGFSQADNQYYFNGLQYLIDWTGTSERTVRRTLNTLVKKGYISKTSSPGSVDKLKALRPTQVNLTTPTPVNLTAPTPVKLARYPGHFG